MKFFRLTISSEDIVKGKVQRSSQTIDVQTPDKPEEVSIVDWNWITEQSLSLPPELRELHGEAGQDLEAWTPDLLRMHYDHLEKICVRLLKLKPSEAKNMPIFSKEDAVMQNAPSVMHVYRLLSANILNYKPSDPGTVAPGATFTHLGRTFCWPDVHVDGSGSRWPGSALQVVEAITALNYEAISRGGKKFESETDAEYKARIGTKLDIELLATLARPVVDGEVQYLPVEDAARDVAINERKEFWKDAPMTYALDMRFFLTNWVRTLQDLDTTVMRSAAADAVLAVRERVVSIGSASSTLLRPQDSSKAKTSGPRSSGPIS
jgi:hypothetical protein